MIAEKITDPEDQDSFKDLALYVAAAKTKGEKLHSLWIEGCNAGTEPEDLDLAIIEATAAQRLNNRAKKTKNYHLVISFRHEDKLPDAEGLKDIEREVAKALGFEEHQRVIGVHQNTSNYHMHVAYNKIHPKTHNIHTPFRDYHTLAEVCKKMEIKYGLATDYDQDKKNERENAKSKKMEAHTWEESFHTYVKNNKDHITENLQNSNNWQEFHKANDDLNIRFKPRGNGLVIENTLGKERIKASDLGREFSKKSLEDKFGPYQAPVKAKSQSQSPIKPKQKDQYKRRPITKHPNTAKYWKRYMGVKNSKDSMARKAFRSWKEFLQAEALSDPLAMAIIIYQKKLFNILLSPIPELPTGLNNIAQRPFTHQVAKETCSLQDAVDRIDQKATKEIVSVDPALANYMGAFKEDALSAEDAGKSRTGMKMGKTTKKYPKVMDL